MQTHTMYCPRNGSKHLAATVRRTYSLVFLFAFFFSASFSAGAQSHYENLVPNPSFEQANCPTGYTGHYSQIANFIPDWHSGTSASPDPFTSCGTPVGPNSTLVPNVIFGNQHANTGTNYLGIGFYSGWYEYIGARLRQPLVAGVRYHVSFYASRADLVRYASNSLAIYFSKHEINGDNTPSTNTLAVKPQFVQDTNSYITSDTSWTLVKGSFVAGGGEQYLTLGCFRAWNVNHLQNVYPAGSARCYYYIDDVSVVAEQLPFNNASVAAVTGITACQGLQAVQVEVKNLGYNPISSLTVNWMLDGVLQPPVSITAPIDTIGSAAGNTAIVKLGDVAFAARGTRSIAAWPAYPNNLPDTTWSDDTLHQQTIFTGLSGTYTIGGLNPDYATVADAAADLDTFGVCGPVVFNIRPGSYAEKLVVPAVKGASLTNTITFRSEAGHRDSVTLVSAALNNADATVRLAGASYVTIEHITLVQNALTAGNVVLLQGKATGNTIRNCRIHTRGNSNPQAYNVMVNSAAVRAFTLTNNVIEGGYVPVNVSGSIVGHIHQVTIEGNRVSKGFNASVNVSYGSEVNITQNSIEIPDTVWNTMHSGINSANSKGVLIRNNIVKARNARTNDLAGIRIASCTGTAANPVVVAGNAISLKGSGSTTGIHSIKTAHINYLHNSVNVYGTANNAGIYLSENTPAAIYNNILSNTGNTGHALYNVTAFSISSGYNLLYSASATLIYNTTGFASLNSYRAAYPEQEVHSMNYRAPFMANDSLEVNTSDSACWAANGRGIHLGATQDMNGITRPASKASGVPDLGAWEFTPATIPPVATALPAHLPSNQPAETTQLFLFAGDTVAMVHWAAYTTIPEITVRQYSGERPADVVPAQYGAYFYTDLEGDPGVYTFALDLYYRDNWSGNNPAKHDMRLAQKDPASPWYTHGAVLPDTVRNRFSVSALASLSRFTVTDAVQPLPVKLRAFSGKKQDADAVLEWTTASEAGNRGFEVQRSVNGQTFDAIGFVNSSNSMPAAAYVYTDRQAFAPDRTGMYYRLRQVDLSGQSRLSPVVFIPATTLQELTVYPNPFASALFVVGLPEAAGPVNAQVLDVTGRQVWSGVVEVTGGAASISGLEALKAGAYTLMIDAAAGKQYKKLLKQ